MILIIILVSAKLVLSYYLYRKEIANEFDYNWLFALIIFVLCASSLIVVLSFKSREQHDYNKFVAKRYAFEETLRNARNSNNIYEVSAIVRDIAKWNVDLASYQYDNKSPVIGFFIDDRFETLKSLK